MSISIGIDIGGTKCALSVGECAPDAVIRVPESETYKIQELHLPVYHALCAELEANLF